MPRCRSFSSFSVFSFLKYFIPANRAPPMANVMAKDFQETGPGFKGHAGSLLPFRSGVLTTPAGAVSQCRGGGSSARSEARQAFSGLAQSRPSKTLAVLFPGPQTRNP